MKGIHEQLKMYSITIEKLVQNLGFPLLNIVDPINFDSNLKFKDRYFLRLILHNPFTVHDARIIFSGNITTKKQLCYLFVIKIT